MRRASIAAQLATAVGLMLLTGCASGNCDPSQADFFSGIGCAASGGYSDREAALREHAAAAQANLTTQQDRSTNANAAVANASQDLEHRKAMLAVLDGRMKDLRRQLAQAGQQQNTDQAALQHAQAQLAELQARRNAVSPQSTDAQLRALDEQTRALSDQMSHGLQ